MTPLGSPIKRKRSKVVVMNVQPPTPPSSQLPRVLGPWMATALVIGTVIGSGVFKKAASVAQIPDFGLVMSAWVLAGILTLFGALALAEVAVLLPRAGGNYVYLKESYGRVAGFLWGWVEFWMIRAGSIAALATVFTMSIHDVLRQTKGGDVLTFWQKQAMTMTVIFALSLLNARGTRLGGILQVVVTTVKVASLLLVALLPFLVIALVSDPRATPTTANMSPTWPSAWLKVDWSVFGGALVGIFFAYHGWMNIAPVAEEVTNPQRNLPLALLVGVCTCIVLYVSANAAYYLIIPRNDLLNLTERTVVGEFSFRLLGSFGLMVASCAVMISVFGALNGNLLVGPRLLFAMGRDGLAPRSLAQLHPRYLTPARATFVLAGWSILLVFLASLLIQNRLPTFSLSGWTIDPNLPPKKELFDVVTDFAMFGAISFETLAVASLFVLRPRTRNEQVPYRCPFYPWLPIVYVTCMTAVLINMFWTQRTESLVGLGFMVVGLVVYALFLRKAH